MGAIHVHVHVCLARPLLAYCVEGAGHETAFKFNMQSTPAIFTVSIAIMVCMCDEHTSLHTHVHPGEKDHVNARLARALVGTTRLYADLRE